MDKAALALFVAQYGGPAVFLAVVLETFLSFLPTPPLVLAAGALFVPPDTSTWKALAVLSWRVALPGAFGTAVGGLGVFWIFWAGGRPLVERFGRWFGVKWSDVESLEKKMEKRQGPIIFITRVIPILPTALVSAACGVLRTDPAPFFWWTLAGAFPRWLFIAWMGWAGGRLVG